MGIVKHSIKLFLQKFHRDTFLKGLSLTSVVIGIKSVLPICQYAFFARYISAEDFGLIAMVLLVIGFISIFSDCGFSNVIISRDCSDDDHVMSTFLYIHLITGLLLMCAYIAGSSYFLKFIQCNEINNYRYIIGLLIPLLSVNQFLLTAFQKKLKFKIIAISESVSTIIGVCLSIALVVSWHTIGAYIWGMVITNLILMTFLLFNIGNAFTIKTRIDVKQLAVFFKPAMYQLFERIVNYVSGNIDKVVIKFFFGLNMLGIYNCAYQLMIKPVSLINMSFTKVAMPFFSKAAKDNALLNSEFLNVLKKITSLTLPLYAVVFIYADEIVMNLYGKNFQQSGEILKYLIIIGILWTFGNPLGAYLVALGKMKTSFILNLCQTVIVTLTIYISAHFSIIALLISYISVSLIFSFPIDYLLLRFYTKLHFPLYLKTVGVSIIPALIAVIMMILIKTTVNSDNIFLVIMEIIAGIIVYTILYYLITGTKLFRNVNYKS